MRQQFKEEIERERKAEQNKTKKIKSNASPNEITNTSKWKAKRTKKTQNVKCKKLHRDVHSHTQTLNVNATEKVEKWGNKNTHSQKTITKKKEEIRKYSQRPFALSGAVFNEKIMETILYF